LTKVKICGLKKIEHALIAAELGVDFLGFVFVEGVRRQISVFDALEIIKQLKETYTNKLPQLVGLFANQESSYVNQVVRQCGLDIVQLCGVEGPKYWSKINCSIIKQVKVDTANQGKDLLGEIKQRVDDVTEAGHIALLDSYEPGALGGTGKTFDWSIAKLINANKRIILAGGLTADNVNNAITTVHPLAVDVSSGVETDGQKDESKLRNFINNARNADK
jgi:phosphoribosylanthranilate isomerase